METWYKKYLIFNNTIIMQKCSWKNAKVAMFIIAHPNNNVYGLFNKVEKIFHEKVVFNLYTGNYEW